jgi:membrane protein DedA with SNARE-associated domain
VDSLATPLRNYGVLFFACVLEGDISLLVAGLLVHLGLFGGLQTFLVAVVGLITPDILLF